MRRSSVAEAAGAAVKGRRWGAADSRGYNKTQVLAKQLRLSIGILFRHAVPEFSKWIAKFLNQKVWVEPGRMERAFAWAVFSGDDPRLRSCYDEVD